MDMIAGPGIAWGVEIDVAWHSLSCACHNCLRIDRISIGPTINYGYATITAAFDLDERPSCARTWERLKKVQKNTNSS